MHARTHPTMQIDDYTKAQTIAQATSAVQAPISAKVAESIPA